VSWGPCTISHQHNVLPFRYLTDFACVYRSVISVGLHTNSHRSDMLYILQRVQV
jgi:hypothetical protein